MRECSEELGIDLDQIELLGIRLLSIRNRCKTICESPCLHTRRFETKSDEVGEVFTVPYNIY